MRHLRAPLTRVATLSTALHIGLKVPPGENGSFPVAFKGFLVMSAFPVMQLMSQACKPEDILYPMMNAALWLLTGNRFNATCLYFAGR